MSSSRVFSDKSSNWVENIWRENSSQIYKQCRLRSSCKEAADDLFQEVALRFCKHATTLNVDISLYSWFNTVIRNTHYEMYRRGNKMLPMSFLREKPLVYDAIPENASVHHRDRQGEILTRDELDFFLEVLDPEERMVIELTFLGGITLHEASRYLGYSKNSLSKIRCSAIEKMKNYKIQCDLQLKKRDAPLVLLEDLLTTPCEIS